MKELFKGVSLEDRISVPTQRTMTDAGQMIVPCAFARTGTLVYKASTLGLTDSADELIDVYRDEVDVFATDAMDTFRSAPVTIGHPKDENGKRIKLTADNAADLQVGMLEGMPVRDEDLLTGTLVITNQEAIDAIESGTVELSAGYTCDLYEEDGKYFQKNIKANHIAIVKKGRAGSSCSIADEDDVTDIVKDDVTIEDAAKDGGDGIGKNDDKDFDTTKLAEGTKHEMEHTDDEEVAKSIAKDHLAEDEDYYTKLKSIEDEQEVSEKDGVVVKTTTRVIEKVGDVSVETVTEKVFADMSEADAANMVAEEEEMEAEYSNMDAEWAEGYAQDSALMAKAHAEVAKAARKIANKKAKSMNDSADDGGDTNLDGHNLTDDVAQLLVALDMADEVVVAFEKEISDMKEVMDSQVTALCDVILLAKDMTDLEDFTGKSVNEIKGMVVFDVLDIDLSEKGEAYIDARFDILCEDSDNLDTPMGKLLKNQIMNDSVPTVKVDKVAEARQKMIDRNTK